MSFTVIGDNLMAKSRHTYGQLFDHYLAPLSGRNPFMSDECDSHSMTPYHINAGQSESKSWTCLECSPRCLSRLLSLTVVLPPY